MRLFSPATTMVLLPIAAIFVVSRASLLLVLKIAVATLPAHPDTRSAASLLCHWDCIWYLSIADIGYSEKEILQGTFTQTNFCFSPLLPVAIRLLAPFFHGNILYAGLAFTNACFFAALVYVYRYARLLGNDRNTALVAVGLIAVLPQSIAFSALLSESPFLLFLAMAIYHARRGDYLIAGLAAGALSATRANGVLFIVFALALLIRNEGIASLLTPWRRPERYIPLIFAPLGMFVFWAYCFATTGDAFAQVSAEDHGWNWQFHPLWENLPAMLRVGGQPRCVAVTGLATLALAALLLRTRQVEEFLFCAAVILLVLSGSGGSLFRYWIVLFPIWVALASVLARRPLPAAIAFAAVIAMNVVMIGLLALRSPLSL